MDINDKLHLDNCWKVFEEELSFIIGNSDFGHKTIVTTTDEIGIKDRLSEFCNNNNIDLVYVDCRTITLKEANAIRNANYYDETVRQMIPDELDKNYKDAVQKCFKNKLYLIDHISEIPDTSDQQAIYNMIVYSWKDNEGANVIFVKSGSVESKPYLSDIRYCGYSSYGEIVFDPTIEPSGEQQYVMERKIKTYNKIRLT
ncbi:MAG: hypothetical protein E7066_09400 [Lentimicrobiaceae bacterium]|nr:hypothetical protein [Lentimicrobiaceae bacterium]